MKTACDFDPAWYLKQYPDVAASGRDPKVHFLLYGRNEGRWGKRPFVSDEIYTLAERLLGELSVYDEALSKDMRFQNIRTLQLRKTEASGILLDGFKAFVESQRGEKFINQIVLMSGARTIGSEDHAGVLHLATDMAHRGDKSKQFHALADFLTVDTPIYRLLLLELILGSYPEARILNCGSKTGDALYTQLSLKERERWARP
ncbi:hypothetical protein [Asticcacaulis tiandongensis]|uniref:hypothetical protein n=1 Tax=Asticcacaulis tiandongensis TaxID=2565365 RepID=UPI0015E85E94|nr:hypothetical protein [Asticcacaulis tiandongensis]